MPSERIQKRIDALLDEADAAFGARDWQRLRDTASDVLSLDSENADAQTFLSAAAKNLEAAPGSSPAAPSPPPAPAPALPATLASGRYAVRRFLGEGGRKRVYLAHDSRLDREVAVAVIKTDGLDQQGLSRVRREAQAMAKLGDHPHVVTIHDVGEDNGQPYIVSQYMSGGAVDGLELPLPVERTLEIAKGVCRGLVHAHAHGIIHRDLKPGNVWLSADGTAQIGDFGLAVAFEQSRLTMQGMLVGTVAYMPPEQALGGEVTPKADLYSLGCMLYELITGRPPFVSDNPTAVISQHINTPPVAPSWLSDSCPESLEEVVLRLLAKDPAERPASAAEVLAALEQVDPTEKSASHSDSNILDRLALGVFVGREHELERLRKAFDNAVSGHGGLVMLVGEPGIGKTRTTQELETYARMRGATVLWGRTHESAGAPPYFPWLQAGNQYATAHADDIEALIGPHMPPGAGAELSRIFPWFRQAQNFVEPAAEPDPEVAQFRLFDAYTSYLKAIASQGPLVVAIDDLHWADKPTLQLLRHIARELSRTRILIVGNYRDTDITRQSALSETLASLNRESGFDRIVLRGLSKEEVGAYIKARANVEPRREVLDRIFEETEGNAFFLSEVVNLMAQEGTLTKTSISDIAIPDGVKEALGRRLNRLSEETNDLLQVAAIIGRDFTYDTLTLLGERDEDALLKMVEEALDARVIEETDQAGRYRFTHAQMQETLLAELSTTRRVRLQGQVGEALEQRYGAKADERAARLAQHFAEASTLAPRFSEKAAKYSAIAGREAFEQSAYPDAFRHFKAALSVREGQELDDAMAGLLLDYARASYATADGREGWRAVRQAFDYFEKTGNVARAVEAALIPDPVVSTATHTRMLERALALVPDGSAEYAELNASLGVSLGGVANDPEGADEALRRAEAVATNLGLDKLRLKILLSAAAVNQAHGRIRDQIDSAEQAIALGRDLGDIRAQAAGHRICALNGALDRRDAAREHARASFVLAEGSRDAFLVYWAAVAETSAATFAGDWATSRAAAARGLDVEPRSPGLLQQMAHIELQIGDTAKARDYLGLLADVVQTVRSTEDTAALAWFPGSAAFYCYATGTVDYLPQVEQVANSVVGSGLATPFWAGVARVGLSLRAYLLADQEAAREQLSYLEPYSGTIFCQLTVDHIRGLLFETLGQLGEAIEMIELTASYPRSGYGFRPAWSWAAYDCARIRLERNAPGDRQRARALIDDALGHARTLGMKPLIERLLTLKLQDQGIGTTGDIYTSIVAVSDTVQRDRPDLTLHAAPDGTVTLLFSDIENSTALNEQMGDAKWMALLRAHNAVIDAQVDAHDGHVVKTMGDGYMVAFKTAADGLKCAIAIQRALVPALTPNPSPDATGEGSYGAVRVRIGLHTGEMVREGDDFFGRHVNLAARVAGHASGGEIFVSSVVRELVSGQPFAFDDAGERPMKGFEQPVRVWAARWA